MRPNWQEYKTSGPDSRGRWAAFYVTMNPKGEIVMSRPTYQKLGEPKAVNLLFDTVNNRIGLKPTALGVRNAVRVGIRGKFGGRVVRAFPLLGEFRISLPDTIRFYDADIDDDGVLILDLRTARIPPAVAKRRERMTTPVALARGTDPTSPTPAPSRSPPV